MKLSIIAATLAVLSTALAAPLLDHVANGAADKILRRDPLEKRLLNDVANGALDGAI